MTCKQLVSLEACFQLLGAHLHTLLVYHYSLSLIRPYSLPPVHHPDVLVCPSLSYICTQNFVTAYLCSVHVLAQLPWLPRLLSCSPLHFCYQSLVLRHTAGLGNLAVVLLEVVERLVSGYLQAGWWQGWLVPGRHRCWS